MLFKKITALSLAIGFSCATLFAQTAADIINKNIDAMGGREKLSKLVSVYEENTTAVMGQNLESKVWVVNGKGMRTEMEMMGAKIITVMTKDTGWMSNPMMGNGDPQPLPMQQVKQAAARMDLRGQFINYVAMGYKATYMGKETVDGKPTYKVQLSKPGEGTFLYYIDATTYYVDKLDVTASSNGNQFTSSMTFTNYKKTPEGYIFPFSTEISSPQAAGGQGITNTITKVVPNQPVDPKLFQKP